MKVDRHGRAKILSQAEIQLLFSFCTYCVMPPICSPVASVGISTPNQHPGYYGKLIDEGASTHSFRRSALTQMSDAGIPLKIIQEVSGHRSLSQLQNYLEVRDSQVLGAVTALSMLSPVGEEVRKRLKTFVFAVNRRQRCSFPHVKDTPSINPTNKLC